MRGFYGFVSAARAALAVMVVGVSSCNNDVRRSQPQAEAAQNPTQAAQPAPSIGVRTRIGFRSRNQLDQHFAKHGREFGSISRSEYLLAAQQLRDKPAGGDVLEIARSDGTVSRFDRATGAFLAFNGDGTIRTFFKPNDGENYFRRQAQRSH